MTVEYPGTYLDTRGREALTVTNDGEVLRTEIRGVEFAGTDFDALSPVEGAASDSFDTFVFNQNCLCACTIDLKIPIPVVVDRSEVQGTLHVELKLGSLSANGGIGHERLQLVLAYAQQQIPSSGRSGWFEDELLKIQRLLPDGVFIKACSNCLYSDYSPYGHGLYGEMRCFRNIKTEYLRVKSKSDFWKVHDRYDRLVQETYLCSEFSRRAAGTGYRG